MDVSAQLNRLATLSPADLDAEWATVFGEAAPALSPSVLRRALAHRVQELALGGLSAVSDRILDHLACSPSTQIPDPPIRLKAGTRLLREWQGRKHAVLVTEEGLLFEGALYRSLSQVARKITGAHWSGPRFFGLGRPVAPPRQEKAHG